MTTFLQKHILWALERVGPTGSKEIAQFLGGARRGFTAQSIATSMNFLRGKGEVSIVDSVEYIWPDGNGCFHEGENRPAKWQLGPHKVVEGKCPNTDTEE